MDILNNKNRAGSLLMLVFSLFYLRAALAIPLDESAFESFIGSRTIPVALAATAIVFSLINLLAPSGPAETERITASVAGFQWKPVGRLVALMTAYALSFDFFGFVAGGFLFLFLGFLSLGERRIFLALAVAGGLVGFMWGLLTRLFGLNLEAGLWYHWLAGG